MFEVIMIILVILFYAGAMVRAYWNNGGWVDFTKSFKEGLDKWFHK